MDAGSPKRRSMNKGNQGMRSVCVRKKIEQCLMEADDWLRPTLKRRTQGDRV